MNKEVEIPQTDDRISIERFQKFLNSAPDNGSVFQNKHQGNKEYIPISHIQMLLDEAFLGLWTTENFRFQLVANEMAGSIDLKVFHPIAKCWITRTGNAATMIRQSSGAQITDIGAKMKNACEMDFPHLLSDCIKSAAKSLGVKFGRDLNRAFIDHYDPIAHKAEKAANEKQKVLQVQNDYPQISEGLESINDLDALGMYQKQMEVLYKADKNVQALFDNRKRELSK